MGYTDALEKAGATVAEYRQFGDYQGTWLAKVAFRGELGWVTGSFGSCSGCDAFEAEFDCCYPDPADADAIADLDRRLALFGLSYLEGIASQTQIENELRAKLADEDDYFREENQEILDFVLAFRWDRDDIEAAAAQGQQNKPAPSI